MKTFKEILEDVRLNPFEGVRPGSLERIKGFTEEDVPLFGKPVASHGPLDLYQVHHGDSSHRGHGMFININNRNPFSVPEYNGGAFIVHDRENNKFVGVMEYDSHERRPTHLHVNFLKSTSGPHKGIRNFIYDNVADKLGYTIVSDSVHTRSGQRGWMKDIQAGKNITVRYVNNADKEEWDELPAKDVLPIHIWSGRESTILHPNASISPLGKRLYDERDVLLVRHPKR